MKMNSRMRRGFTLVELLVVISIIATLAGVGIPVIMSRVKDGARAEAIGNIKQVGLAMFTFEQDYGSYPWNDTSTGGLVEVVKDNSSSDITDFDFSNSNGCFRMLIAAGSVDTERSFYAKAPYTKKPDNVMASSKCLAAGEVGFAYVMATATAPLSSSGNSGRPLLAAAVYNGLDDGSFDPDVYGKKAVVFRMDNSATVESVRPSDKKVSVGNGKTLFQGGDKDTVWGVDTSPIIKAPSKKPGS